MADTLGLSPSAERRGGSSPSRGTNYGPLAQSGQSLGLLIRIPWVRIPHGPPKKELRMRLYVDVDETLVFWENASYPFSGNYEINNALVTTLQRGIDSGEYNITIWSAGGAWWAAEINKQLFSGYNLPSSGKNELYHKIPENSYAIDDRLVQDRFYLYKFKKVFLPEEFIDYAEKSYSNSKIIGRELYNSIKKGDWGTEEL